MCTPTFRSDPAILMERIRGRGRREEADLGQDRLDQLHTYHEDWLMDRKFPVPAPVLVINTDGTVDEFLGKVDRMADVILSHLS